MTLEQVAALSRRIEARMLDRYGYFTVKTIYGLQYYNNPFDAQRMREVHSNLRAFAISKRELRHRRSHAFAVGYHVTSP